MLTAWAEHNGEAIADAQERIEERTVAGSAIQRQPR